jgi:hypothetical protein
MSYFTVLYLSTFHCIFPDCSIFTSVHTALCYTVHQFNASPLPTYRNMYQYCWLYVQLQYINPTWPHVFNGAYAKLRCLFPCIVTSIADPESDSEPFFFPGPWSYMKRGMKNKNYHFSCPLWFQEQVFIAKKIILPGSGSRMRKILSWIRMLSTDCHCSLWVNFQRLETPCLNETGSITFF